MRRMAIKKEPKLEREAPDMPKYMVQIRRRGVKLFRGTKNLKEIETLKRDAAPGDVLEIFKVTYEFKEAYIRE